MRFMPIINYSEADAGGGAPGTEVDDALTTEADEDAGADTGDDETGADGDFEDYDFEDQKLKLPKKFAKFVKDGVLADRDYRFKTGQTAEEMRAAKAEREQYGALIKDIQGRLKASEPAKPDTAMLDPASEKYDRDTYYREAAAHDHWKAKMEAANAAKTDEDNKSKAESVKAKHENFTKERAALLKAVPEWKDEAKMGAEMPKIAKHAASIGISPQEWAEITDHRVLVALREQMMYRAGLKRASAAPEPDPEKPKPQPIVRKVIGSGNSGVDNSLSDRTSTENWMKARQKQLAAKHARR